MARPLPRRWLVAGAVALLAVGVVVAALLTAGDDDRIGVPGSAGESSATVEATATADVGTPGVAGVSQPPDADDAVAEAGLLPPTGDQDAPSLAGATKPPGQPAAPGSALAAVTVPPQRTVSMIDSDMATSESRYDVAFDVYGFGPPGGAGSLVILVRTSSPVRTVEQPYDFTGRNVLVRLAPAGGPTVTVGGRYRGVIALKPNGSVLVPVLSDVRSGS